MHVTAPSSTTKRKPVRLANESASLLFKELTATSGQTRRSPIRHKIRVLGDAAAPALRRGLQHEDPYVRWEAINLLGDLALLNTRDVMISFALEESETHARWRAFWAVSRLPRDHTVPILLEALSGKWQHRWHAALMLSMMDRSEATPVIKEALQRADGRIAWEALSAAKALPDSSLTPLVCAYLAPESALHLRQEAALALGRIGGSTACKALAQAINDPAPGVRWRAALSLSRFDSIGSTLIHERRLIEKDAGVIRILEEIIDGHKAGNAVT